MYMETRGIRNNNPANIVRSSSCWKGLCLEQKDSRFCQFTDVKYGIRAFFVLMRTYHYKYKLNSIKAILHRYAPLVENNTYAYIASVTKLLREQYSRLGAPCDFDENTIVNCWRNPKDPSFMLRCFAKAVMQIESKYNLTDEELSRALSLM